MLCFTFTTKVIRCAKHLISRRVADTVHFIFAVKKRRSSRRDDDDGDSVRGSNRTRNARSVYTEKADSYRSINDEATSSVTGRSSKAQALYLYYYYKRSSPFRPLLPRLLPLPTSYIAARINKDPFHAHTQLFFFFSSSLFCFRSTTG